jgi:ABC-type sugar transport system permease subunit
MFVTPIAVGLMFRFLLDDQLGVIPQLLDKFGISIPFFNADLALFSLVFEYVFAITQGGPGTATETIQYHVYRVGFQFYRLSEAAAMAWTLMVVVMALIVVLFWRFTRGQQQ